MISKRTEWSNRQFDPSPFTIGGACGAIIGQSRENRPIFCLVRGHLDAPLKVLVLAGQHGDERPALRALGSLLAVPPEVVAARLPNLQLALIPEANPDGCAARSRCNADGLDLNRDHQLLLSHETMAIHQFVRRWQPQVILDLHSYPSRRLHLLARNVVLDHDVFLDVPNHPAVLERPGNVAAAAVLRGLLRDLALQDVRAERYTIVKVSGRARHSSPDVVDARNGLALRYGTFTILVENRQPRYDDSATERRRLRGAQERALWAMLRWLDRNHSWFAPLTSLAPPAPGLLVPVHCRYADEGHKLRIVCRDADEGRPASVTFPRYSASVEVRRAVPLPDAYAVPREYAVLMALLRRHGFSSTQRAAGKLCPVEKLRIERARPPRRPGRPPRRIVLVPHRMNVELDHYEVFPTRQKGGDALAVFLEPESKHGVHRCSAMQILLQAPCWYPVLRVLNGKAA